MSLHTVDKNSQTPDLANAVAELQRLKQTVVTGAAAATKMNLAAIRKEDTVLSVLAVLDAAASVNTPADDTANVSIVETHATGTITISGNPVEGDTVVVNAKTYTFKAAPKSLGDVKITAGNNTQMAADLAAAINARETKRTTVGNAVTPGVTATSALGVVTVTAVVDGAAGNAITLTESATNVAVSGAGTLTNGSDTGGLTSTSNNTGKTLVVLWYDKS